MHPDVVERRRLAQHMGALEMGEAGSGLACIIKTPGSGDCTINMWCDALREMGHRKSFQAATCASSWPNSNPCSRYRVKQFHGQGG